MKGPESKCPGASANAHGAGVQLGSRTSSDTTAGRGAPPQLPTRDEAIALKCRDCVHDEAAAGTWRQQVTACHLTACPLWRFRPLAGGIPAWVKARDPRQLPPDWRSLPHEAVIAILSGKLDARPNGCAVEAIRRRAPVETWAPCSASA